jgi:hypothetical protein
MQDIQLSTVRFRGGNVLAPPFKMSAVVAKNASVGGVETKERTESSPKLDIMTANANPAQKSHIV